MDLDAVSGSVGSVEDGILDGGGDRRREGAILGLNVAHPIVTNGDSAALCLEGWRYGSSQITLGFLVFFVPDTVA